MLHAQQSNLWRGKWDTGFPKNPFSYIGKICSILFDEALSSPFTAGAARAAQCRGLCCAVGCSAGKATPTCGLVFAESHTAAGNLSQGIRPVQIVMQGGEFRVIIRKTDNDARLQDIVRLGWWDAWSSESHTVQA